MISRIASLLLGWGGVGLAYLAGAHAQGAVHVLPLTSLDARIGVHPEAVWIYLAFFLLVPVAFSLAPRHRIGWLCEAMLLCAIASLIFYLGYPTTRIPAPVGVGGGGLLSATSGRVLSWLSAWDTPLNCMPSLHGALTALCLGALISRRRPLWNLFLLGTLLLMCWAIIATGRHGAFDLAAGLALGALAGLTAIGERRPAGWTGRHR